MKKLKKAVSLIVAITMLVAFASCGGGDNHKVDVPEGALAMNVKGGSLNIEYYDGGYGREWIEKIAGDYEKEFNCKVTLTPDARTSTDLANSLKTGKRLADIYFCQSGLEAYSDYVYQGKLATLDDVYNTEITKLDGTRVAIKDYMKDYAVAYCSMKQDTTDTESHQFSMPWGSITIGMVVNTDIMNETKHQTTEAGKWTAGEAWTTAQIEQSFSNLLLYYSELNLKEGQFPLGLNGTDIHWLLNPVYVWWAQYQGVYEENTANNVTNGSYYDFFNFESPDVLKQEGLLNAWDMMEQLIVDDTQRSKRNAMYKNIPTDYSEITLQKLEYNFMIGSYATMFAGSFFESETKEFESESGYRANYELINFPNCDKSATDAQGNPLSITYNTIGERVVVPENAPNKAHAKQFLAYMCNEKYVLDFSQKTGTLRPFNYDPLTLAPNWNYTKFQRQIFEMNTNSDYQIVSLPVKAMQNNSLTPISTFYSLGMFGSASRAEILSYIRYFTPEELFISGGTTPDGVKFKGIYQITVDKWKDYLDDLGLKENKF